MNTKTNIVTTEDPFSYQQLKPFGLCLSPSSDTEITSLESEDISFLAQLARQHKIVVLRGFSKLNKDELINLSKRFGELLEWNFGSVLDLQVHEDPKNYLFTAGEVPYHWDGAFAASVPHFQLFQCVKAPPIGNGGETTFCDTTKVLNNMTQKQVQKLKQVNIEYCTDKLAHYGGDIQRDLITEHPETKEDTLRFAEPVETGLNPVSLKVNGLGTHSQNAFLEEFVPQLYQSDVVYAHQWNDGDLLLADNHALIHGRNAFSKDAARHIRRVHIL